MKKEDLRSITLEGFPDYDVRLFYSNKVLKGCKASISRYGFYGRSWGIPNKPMMFVNDSRKLSDASGVPTPGCKLRIDASCNVPVTLLKERYTVLTSRSPRIPDFIVLGESPYNNNSFEFRVFISEKFKQILCVYEYSHATADYDGQENIPDLNAYRLLFNQIDEFYANTDSFFPFTGNELDVLMLIPYSKGIYEFVNKLRPDSEFVLETDLVTGTKPVTAEFLNSCMRMLDSMDWEIRDSAMLALASSDYSKCKRVLRYLLGKYHLDEVKRLKNKSSAVKWMAKTCPIDRYCSLPFTSTEADLAKDYLVLASQGAVSYPGGEPRNVLRCTDSKFLAENHKFIKNIPGMTYDLDTANLLAMIL